MPWYSFPQFFFVSVCLWFVELLDHWFIISIKFGKIKFHQIWPLLLQIYFGLPPPSLTPVTCILGQWKLFHSSLMLCLFFCSLFVFLCFMVETLCHYNLKFIDLFFSVVSNSLILSSIFFMSVYLKICNKVIITLNVLIC